MEGVVNCMLRVFPEKQLKPCWSVEVAQEKTKRVREPSQRPI